MMIGIGFCVFRFLSPRGGRELCLHEEEKSTSFICVKKRGCVSKSLRTPVSDGFVCLERERMMSAECFNVRSNLNLMKKIGIHRKCISPDEQTTALAVGDKLLISAEVCRRTTLSKMRHTAGCSSQTKLFCQAIYLHLQ